MLPLSLDHVINHMSDMVFIMSVDEEGQFRYLKMNPAAMQASGLTADAYGATFHDVIVSSEADVLRLHYHNTVVSGRPTSFVLNHNGQVGQTQLNVLETSLGPCVVGVVRDVTQALLRENELRIQVSHDYLTGLLNRLGIETIIESTLIAARETATLLTVFMIDADNLKEVNDTWGHFVGDMYLRDFGRRIQNAVRGKDTVARVGGDEFLVAVNLVDTASVVALAERICASLFMPWVHGELRINMSASIGVASFPVDGISYRDVIQAADKALYEAKFKGGNQYKIAGVGGGAS